MKARIATIALLLCLAGMMVTLALVSGSRARASSTETTAAVQRQPGANQLRVFQQGLEGYSGASDTWVSSLDWDTPRQYMVNYGQNPILRLNRNGGDNPLLRFDLSAIPSNSAVIFASLSLYNLTPANCSSGGSLVRRIGAYAALSGWDEGNQVQGVVSTTVGAHGATGDYAFLYYSGGTNVPWGGRGMLAGTDFAAASLSAVDVAGPGWYHWDVTVLARAWVRGEQPNDGLTLRDLSGYQDGNCDWRDFVSAQEGTNSSLRPKLSVVYNPDVPYANAGPDQENLEWDGGAITLDGSASHDRPGGDDGSLVYTWRILQAAFGSGLSGAIGASQVLSFTPDAAGDWDIQLTVTNTLGESAQDDVHLHLLRLSVDHPRIYLTAEKLAALRLRATPANPRWVQLLGRANDPSGEMQAKALVSQVSGQDSYCDAAIGAALAAAGDASDWATKAGDIALVYDWCHSRLSADQKTTLVSYFNTWGDKKPKGEDLPGWGNYWPGYGYSYGLIGLASYGDNPRAGEWLDEYRSSRYRDYDLPLLERIAAGGGWPEGMIYDWLANWPRVRAVEAWRTATGEDLFQSTAWFRNRLEYQLLHRWPGLSQQWGNFFHPYLSTGDTERQRGSIANYERIMGLILVERFSGEAAARQLQAYLSAAPADNSMGFLYHEEFLWYNPDQAVEAPAPLAHYDPSQGTLLMRSGWPDGAADQDPCATYVTFQSGDHFTYHQHYDQNSFTLFRCDDLALDSGVYSGNGLSYHDVNYYVRTIAHNTLAVFNPGEDFSNSRPDAVSNDGGQRSMYPASRYPLGVEDFDQHAKYYDTGDMLRYEHTARYTYALGDATRAYNNPTYNQAMDTGLSGNTAKVSRFQREFVYLRAGGDGSGQGDALVIFDRVGVTAPAYSGANTKLLFHVLNEPQVNGTPTVVSAGETLYSGSDQASAAAGNAKMFMKTLLPVEHNLRVVGGRGVKAFWVNGANYDWNWSPSEPQPRPVNDFEDTPYGEWRMELEPADTALDHNFLNVLYPALSSTLQAPVTELIAGEKLSGAFIADSALNRAVLFSAAADGETPAGVLEYSYTPLTQTLNIVFDLAPGSRYALEASRLGAALQVELTPDAAGLVQASSQGVLSFLLDPSGIPQVGRQVFLPQVSRE